MLFIHSKFTNIKAGRDREMDTSLIPNIGLFARPYSGNSCPFPRIYAYFYDISDYSFLIGMRLCSKEPILALPTTFSACVCEEKLINMQSTSTFHISKLSRD